MPGYKKKSAQFFRKGPIECPEPGRRSTTTLGQAPGVPDTTTAWQERCTDIGNIGTGGLAIAGPLFSSLGRAAPVLFHPSLPVEAVDILMPDSRSYNGPDDHADCPDSTCMKSIVGV